MSPIGDADAVDGLARSCQDAAGTLDVAARTLLSRVDDLIAAGTWAGPRAEQFRRRADHRLRVLERERNALGRLADELRLRARRIREREDYLRRLERRIRDWADAHPAPDLVTQAVDLLTPLDYGPHAGLIGHYPRHLDPEWETVADRLRAHGAVF